MSLENTNLSRRKLLKAGAIGVPAAGVLAFGSTLVTATSANAISADGWWGEETSTGLQQFMNTVMNADLVVDGVISSQPSSMAPSCPGIVGGWEWVSDDQATGSRTLSLMKKWLENNWDEGNWVERYNGAWSSFTFVSKKITDLSNPRMTVETIKALQAHYGNSSGYDYAYNNNVFIEGLKYNGRLDGPSPTIMALQNEINQYVG